MQNYNLASDQAHFTTNVCAGILGEKIIIKIFWETVETKLNLHKLNRIFCFAKDHHFSC